MPEIKRISKAKTQQKTQVC